MSTCSRKINELKDRLDGFSGYNDIYIFKNLTLISIIIHRIENHCKDFEEFYRLYWRNV